MPQYIEFLSNHYILTTAFIAILAMLIWGEITRFTRGFKDLDPVKAVQKTNQEDAVLVDIRNTGEYRDGHIINAVNIEMAHLEEQHSKIADYKDRPVIAYCQSGSRSALACTKLKQLGFNQVYNLSGGYLAWKNANLPTAKG